MVGGCKVMEGSGSGEVGMGQVSSGRWGSHGLEPHNCSIALHLPRRQPRIPTAFTSLLFATSWLTLSQLQDPDIDSVDHAINTGYSLVERLKRARDKKNWPVATHFLTLPDPEVVPDYYEQIGLPIALDTVEEKLERRAYVDTSAVESDFKRMIANAKAYNEKTSIVYADAEKIRKIVSVFMERENPAYKTANYTPTPTAVPEKGHTLKIEPTARPATATEETSEARSSRRSGRNPTSPPAKEHRRASSTPAVKEAEGAGESFEGDNFQQAQEKIITEMMNLTDDEYVKSPVHILIY